MDLCSGGTARSCITEPTQRHCFLQEHSLRIHARPVAENDIPVRLSSRSSTILLDRRLDYLALPGHGTKLDKWTRIEQRENELLRGRKAQAAHDAERMVGPGGRRTELAIPMADLASCGKLNVKFTS